MIVGKLVFNIGYCIIISGRAVNARIQNATAEAVCKAVVIVGIGKVWKAVGYGTCLKTDVCGKKKSESQSEHAKKAFLKRTAVLGVLTARKIRNAAVIIIATAISTICHGLR